MGEDYACVSDWLYERLTFCPHCVHSECIINEICCIAGKERTGYIPICELNHQRGRQVGKWRCLNEDNEAQNKKHIDYYRRHHWRFGKGKGRGLKRW